MKKYQCFLSKNFQFLEVKFSIYLNRRVFVMLFMHGWLHMWHLFCHCFFLSHSFGASGSLCFMIVPHSELRFFKITGKTCSKIST